MNSSCSYHGQLEPRPSGLVPCPCWWCPLVSAAQSGPRAFTAARSVPINTFKMGVLLEMGRLTREEEEMGVRKRKQTEETPRLGIMDAA